VRGPTTPDLPEAEATLVPRTGTSEEDVLVPTLQLEASG